MKKIDYANNIWNLIVKYLGMPGWRKREFLVWFCQGAPPSPGHNPIFYLSQGEKLCSCGRYHAGTWQVYCCASETVEHNEARIKLCKELTSLRNAHNARPDMENGLEELEKYLEDNELPEYLTGNAFDRVLALYRE